MHEQIRENKSNAKENYVKAFSSDPKKYHNHYYCQIAQISTKEMKRKLPRNNVLHDDCQLQLL